MKNLLRLCGFMIAAVLFTFSVQILEADQKHKPFDSHINITFNTADTKTGKKQLVEELNALVKKNGGGMYKEVAGKNNFEKERNIIWFGDKKPSAENIVTDGDRIRWLANGMYGELIHSSHMNDIPLSGEYAVTDNLKSDLDAWAKKNDIEFNELKTLNTAKRFLLYLIHHPSGNALIALNILTVAVFLSYFLIKAKERSIKLLSGRKKTEISKYDTVFLTKNILFGFISAVLIMAVYYFTAKGFENLLLILKSTVPGISLSFLLMIFFSIVLSVIISPKAKHIAGREIPLKRFGHLTTCLKAAAIFFSVFVLTNAVAAAVITQKMAREHSSWVRMKDHFRLSFSNLDELYQDKNLEEVKKFISDMQKDKKMSVSLAIDESIDMSDILKQSGFDRFVLVDEAWLDFADVGIENPKTNGQLIPCHFQDIHAPLKEFIQKQMPLLVNEEVVKTENLNYYTFKGEKMRVLGPGSGNMDALLSVEHPLVIVIDNPAKELKLKGFIIPTLSTGNIIFSDKKVLDKNLSHNILKNFVLSTDGIADLALKTTQDFRELFVSYMAAVLILLATILFVGTLGAKLWAYKDKKRIYIMATNGIRFADIAGGNLKKDLFLSAVFIVLSGLFTYFFKRISIDIIGGVIFGITVLYCWSIFIAYKFFVKKEFVNVIYRV